MSVQFSLTQYKVTMSNPFNPSEEEELTSVQIVAQSDPSEIPPGFLEAKGLTFAELIELAKARATKEVTKKLLDDTDRLWSKLMTELDDPSALEKHFLKLIELKLKTAKSNERKA